MPDDAVYIQRPSTDGFMNMAVDEYLLELCRQGRVRAALRFYEWEPPAVSLGYSQSFDLLDLAACREKGIDVVKRITGGGALLHWQELTYCFVLGGEREVASPWRRQTAAAVSRSLVLGLARLGVRASGRERSAGHKHADLCFASGVENEIEVSGRKLAGCAHKFTREAFFSHGSVMTGPEHVRIAGLMRLDGDRSVSSTARSISENSVSLSELLPAPPSAGQMGEAFRSAFEDMFGLRFASWDLPGDGMRAVGESAARKRAVLAESVPAAPAGGEP